MTPDDVMRAVEGAYKTAAKTKAAALLAEELKEAILDSNLSERFSYITIYPWSVSLNFCDDITPKKQREAVLLLMKALGQKEGTKSKEYTERTLRVEFKDSPFSEDCPLVICKYIPPTCRTVTMTRVIPAVEAAPARVEEYEAIICDRAGEEEAPETLNGEEATV